MREGQESSIKFKLTKVCTRLTKFVFLEFVESDVGGLILLSLLNSSPHRNAFDNFKVSLLLRADPVYNAGSELISLLTAHHLTPPLPPLFPASLLRPPAKMSSFPDYYAILDVPTDCTPDQIKTAYKKCVRGASPRPHHVTDARSAP